VLAVTLLCSLAAAAVPAAATTVTPEARLYRAERNETVRFVTVSSTPATIECTEARINDTIPNSRTNPNSAGSVVTEVPSTSSTFTASFGRCALNGRALSGGPAGVFTLGWNYFTGGPITRMVGMALPRSAFLFYDNTGCQITIGRTAVQSLVGNWTNGASTMVFERQSLFADQTLACGLATFDQVRFSGHFTVISNPPLGPAVLVEP
jgi:hypothetical protein